MKRMKALCKASKSFRKRMLCTHSKRKKRSKLDDKTEKGIFVGYNSQSKGYRIYNLKSNKIIISRDVEFDENVVWNWDEQKIEKKKIHL